jgi:hypothetical protein
MAGSSRVAKYSGFLGSQNSAVFHYGTNANNDVGSVWYAPNQVTESSAHFPPHFNAHAVFIARAGPSLHRRPARVDWKHTSPQPNMVPAEATLSGQFCFREIS